MLYLVSMYCSLLTKRTKTTGTMLVLTYSTHPMVQLSYTSP